MDQVGRGECFSGWRSTVGRGGGVSLWNLAAISLISRGLNVGTQYAPSRKELATLLDDCDMKAIESRFGSRIQFGTAGLRAAMGVGVSRMNDLIVIQASQVGGPTRTKEGRAPFPRRSAHVLSAPLTLSAARAWRRM